MEKWELGLCRHGTMNEVCVDVTERGKVWREAAWAGLQRSFEWAKWT